MLKCCLESPFWLFGLRNTQELHTFASEHLSGNGFQTTFELPFFPSPLSISDEINLLSRFDYHLHSSLTLFG